MGESRRFSVMDTPTLIRVNQHAVELNQNRSVTEEFINKLDWNGTHVIAFSLDHVNYEGTPGVRCQIYCKMKNSKLPQMVYIDITHEEYMALPTVSMDEADSDIEVLGSAS